MLMKVCCFFLWHRDWAESACEWLSAPFISLFHSVCVSHTHAFSLFACCHGFSISHPRSYGNKDTESQPVLFADLCNQHSSLTTLRKQTMLVLFCALKFAVVPFFTHSFMDINEFVVFHQAIYLRGSCAVKCIFLSLCLSIIIFVSLSPLYPCPWCSIPKK